MIALHMRELTWLNISRHGTIMAEAVKKRSFDAAFKLSIVATALIERPLVTFESTKSKCRSGRNRRVTCRRCPRKKCG
jgi:hypothetical protein